MNTAIAITAIICATAITSSIIAALRDIAKTKNQNSSKENQG